MEESFNITLFSGCSLDIYPNNTLSKFTVTLPFPITFEGDDWFVGVTNFACTRIKTDDDFLVQILISNRTDRINIGSNIINVLRHTVPDFYDEIKEPNFFRRYSQTSYLY